MLRSRKLNAPGANPPDMAWGCEVYISLRAQEGITDGCRMAASGDEASILVCRVYVWEQCFSSSVQLYSRANSAVENRYRSISIWRGSRQLNPRQDVNWRGETNIVAIQLFAQWILESEREEDSWESYWKAIDMEALWAVGLLILFFWELILLVSRAESCGGDRTCERLGEDLPMLNDSDSWDWGMLLARRGYVKNKKQASDGDEVVRSRLWWRRWPSVVVGTISLGFCGCRPGRKLGWFEGRGSGLRAPKSKRIESRNRPERRRYQNRWTFVNAGEK